MFSCETLDIAVKCYSKISGGWNIEKKVPNIINHICVPFDNTVTIRELGGAALCFSFDLSGATDK